MAGNVGFATLQVIPSLKGIEGKVAGQLGPSMSKAGAQAGGKFSSGFGGKVSVASRLIGKGLLGGIGIAVAGAAGLVKIGANLHSATAKIRTETGATGKALESLEGSFKRVAGSTPASFGDVATAISTIHKRLDLTGAPLEKLSLQVIRLSRITKTDLGSNLAAVTGVLKNFNISAKDSGPSVDLLFRTSQRTGVSVADLATQLASGGTQLRAAGFSFQESAGLVGLLGKAGLSASDVMPALSKAMAKAAKDGKSAKDVFRDTFNAIRGAPNDIVASGKALDVFGARAGPKLAALIREGKLSYEDFAASLGKGDTIEAAAKATSTWQSKLGVLGNKLQLALGPAAEQMFSNLTNAVVAATPTITSITRVVASLVGGLSHIPGPVLGGAAAMAAFGFTATKIAGPVKKLFGFFGAEGGGRKILSAGRAIGSFAVNAAKATAKIVAQTAAFVAQKTAQLAAAAAQRVLAAAQWALNAAMDANPVTLIIAGLVALGAGLFLAYQKVKPFHDAVDAFGRILASVGQWIISHWPVIIAVLTGPLGVIVLLFVKNWNTIRSLTIGVLGDIVGFFTALPGRIVDGIKAIGQFIWAGILGGFQFLQAAIVFYLQALVTLWIRLPLRVLSAIGNIGMKIWSFVAGGLVTLVGFIGGILGNVVAFFAGLPDRVIGALGNLGGRIWVFIAGSMNNLSGLFGGIVDGIVDFFAGLPRRIGQVLGDIGGAIRRAIDSAVDHLPGPLKSLAHKFGFARGGIVNFPTSGALAVLHGREAILPLDDPQRSMQILANTELVPQVPAAVVRSGRSTGGDGNVTIVKIYPRALLGTEREVIAWVGEGLRRVQKARS